MSMSTSRPAAEASSHAAATRLGPLARNQPAKTNTAPAVNKQPPPPPPPPSLPASHVRLFVTNLRLLDLDLLEDWPSITAQTFSAKNADQKQRISAAEWALFRLFDLWDPAETAQKLRPFFPPLEPLQSLNLRAALYRCLNDIKKNGVLGRESVLRKTMLDECKGDRFFEIMALFSAAVLKKVLATSRANSANAAVARHLGTASTLTSQQQTSLLPLAIAHKAALVNLLRRKGEKRARFVKFEAQLDTKASDIEKRIRKCTDTLSAERPAVAQRDADAVKRQLTDNWVGNQKWLDTILHGDQAHAGDAFLSNRFDKVWHMVERGRRLADAAPEAGLLEDLQSRVHEQQTRLQKWKAFHEQMRMDNTTSKIKSQDIAAPVKDLRFDSHLEHQLLSAKQGEPSQVRRPALRSTYVDILSDMDAELSRVSQSRPQVTVTSLPRRRRSSSSAPRSPARTRRISVPKAISRAPLNPALHAEPKSLVVEPKMLVREQKALFEGLAAGNSMPPPQRRPKAKGAPVYPDMLSDQNSDLRTDAPASPIGHSSVSQTQPDTERESIPIVYPQHVRPALSSSCTSEGSPVPSQPTSFSERSASEETSSVLGHSVPTLEMPGSRSEEALADMIINAIGDATPSPVKKAQPRMSMSLVDRTRMTLSRTPSFDPVLEAPDIMPTAPPTPLPLPRDDRPEGIPTLLERTRLSMAAMSQRTRTSVASTHGTTKRPKREPTSALFPVNQFNPRGDGRAVDIREEIRSGAQTPQEDLLSGDIDYDRVFKSRPRIATSPIFSPEKFPQSDSGADEDFYDEEVTGIDLDDVDQTDDEDGDGFTQNLANSPSKRPGQLRY
jgi:hypothetical protein